MLRPMFGMGGTEILVILIVALLFLGPDKLPEAAKQISKGIRDIKKQSRVLQRTIEDDEHIGGAIRDLKSALRGEDEPIRPMPLKPPKQLAEPAAAVIALAEPGAPEHGAEPAADPQRAEAEPADAKPALTMPPTAGEPDEGVPAAPTTSEDAELAAMVKPAAHTIPHKPSPAADLSDTSEPEHG